MSHSRVSCKSSLVIGMQRKNVYNFLVFLEKDNINFENKMASLSTIAAFDDLRRNQAVLSEGIAEEGK